MGLISDIIKRLRPSVSKRAATRSEAQVERTLEEFQELLGLRFVHKDLLRQALTHRSATAGENQGGNGTESNERLEFLGDSVLGLVVNEQLFHQYPREREGLLTQMKSLLVSRGVLSRKAKEMRVGDFLFLSSGEEESGGRERSSILADSFEAVVGAIYLDQGMEAARSFIGERLMADSRNILEDRSNINWKSLLQEHIQSEQKTHPQYRVTSEDGPDHEKVFTVDVMVGRKALGRGKGKNKKRAQQEAARSALRSLNLLPKGSEGGGLVVGNGLMSRANARARHGKADGRPASRRGRRRGRRHSRNK
jgi:ribonuclease-3